MVCPVIDRVGGGYGVPHCRCNVCSELWVMVCPVDRVGEVCSLLSM